MKILFYRGDNDAQPSASFRSDTAEASIVQLQHGTFILWLDGERQDVLYEKIYAMLVEAWGSSRA